MRRVQPVDGERQELAELMARFKVWLCVIDALPEIHATRDFARRHEGLVYLNYFNEHQKGSPAWNHQDYIVQENRTEALDLSRSMIREGKVGQITSAIQTGVKHGMIDMDSSIKALYEEGKVDARAAFDKAIDKERFRELVGEAAPEE